MSSQLETSQEGIARHLRSYRCIAFILQGGGALGAYQAGAHSALVEAGIQPDWIAGISIGSINAAIIAGNPVDRQVERLQDFWDTITTEVAPWSVFPAERSAINALSSEPRPERRLEPALERYNYLTEKTKAMDIWSAFLDWILNGGKTRAALARGSASEGAQAILHR